MNHSLKTRVLCMLLTLAMVLSILPMAAFATEITEPAPSEPVIIEPAPSEPVVDEPAPSEPVNDEPAPSEPVIGEPAPSDPATSEETEEVVDTEIQKTELSEETDEAAKTVKASGGFPSADLDVSVDKKSTLAPGVTLNTITAYNNKDEQVKMWVTKADMSVDTVKLFASYKNMDPTNYGMSKLTEQVASFNKKAASGDEYYQGTVIAGINSSYYNMTTGKPTGTFVMNGIDVTTESEGNAYGYFAVMKDGSVKIGNKGDYSKDKGNIQEAIGIYTMLIVNGQICSGLDTKTYYPRQTIGITADGDVILMTADGSQAPRSVGLTVLEQAQVMKDLGCVWAGHLDGGGSCTYAAKNEGSNEFKIMNSPSDGSERSISNGFIIASTAVSDGKFASASLTAENEYVTPGSTVAISAIGVDKAGGAAEIPANAVLTATNGSIVDGKFVSDGTVGEATITMTVDGEAVGSTVIHVVLPDAIKFAQSEMVVPYGKTVPIVLNATYGIKTVVIKPSDITFTLGDNAIGTINGFDFTAAAEGVAVTATTLTATVNGTEIAATANLTLGKGSEVLYDFENGQVGNWKLLPWTTTPKVATNLEIVTAETGKIRSGDHAMALEMDFTQEIGTGYQMAALYFPEDVHIKNAQRVGMWVYLPEEFTGLYARYCAYSGPYDPNNAKTNRINGGTTDPTHGMTADTGFVYAIEESGWYYFSLDVSKYSDVYLWKDARCIEFYSSDRDGTAFGYTYVTSDNKQINTNAYGNYTLYIDDVMVDYSSAADDREAPVFGQVSVNNEGEGTTVINRLTQACAPHVIPVFETNKLTMNAAVAEDTTWANATGLNEDSAKCYVDGYAVDCKFANGNIVLENHYFTNGIHTVRFVIADNAGNERSAVRKVNIKGTADNPTLSLVPADPTANKIYAGSLYYVNLETSALADVESVSVTLDLNSVSKWELKGMKVARGFTATYDYVGSEDGVVIKFTRNGDKLEDTKVLASIPVRAWYHTAGVDPVAKWKAQDICPVDVRVEIDSGKMVMKNGDVITFTSDRVRVDTEIYGTYAVLNANGDYANKTSWHIHTPAAIADAAPTCTEAGYTGRTFCAGCNSPIEWGTIIPKTEHNYSFVDGVLKCTCGELFNGTHTDGKIYIDGVVVDGWNGESYYRDGEMLTGLQEIDGIYYDFGTDGVCPNKARLDGFYYDAVAGGYRYFTAGLLTTGEVNIYPEVYFYDANGLAISGKVDVLGYTCYFTDKGAFEKSDDASVVDAGYSGTNIQYVLLKNGKLIVDGQGVMKDYTANGKYPAWIIQNDEMAITSLEVGNGITEIGRFGFYNIKHLKTLTFEENSSLKTIGWAAFGHNWRLTGVTIPASVETLETCAFYNCGAMTEVKFEEGSKLKTIKSCAFQKDIWLETVYIPDSVASIATDAFAGANADVVLQVAKNSVGHTFAVTKGMKYELREGVVAQIMSGNISDTVQWSLLSNGTLKITGSGAMVDYTSHTQQPWASMRDSIKTIVIGKDITTVGNYTFAYCQNTETVEFEKDSKCTTIGVLGFFNNPKLKAITLPETVTYISAYALGDCFALVDVYVPQSVSGIYKTAFTNSKNAVLNVAKGSFAESFAAMNNIAYTTRDFVYIPIASGSCGTNATWKLFENGELWIEGSGAMTNYTAHTQQPWANYRHTIKKIVIDKNITSVGNYAFAYCQNTTSVEFKENCEVTSIGILSFFNNPKLKSITLPETVTYISAYALGDCFELVDVYVPQRTSNIYKTAFTNSKKAVLNVAKGAYGETFAVANNIAHTVRDFVYAPIASGNCGENATWAMYENGELWIGGSGDMTNYSSHTQQPWATIRHTIKKVVVGKNITSIGNYAFAYCQNTTAVDFEEGSKLATVGILSFFNNPNVAKVALPETVTYIAAYAFGDCFALEECYIPAATSNIYKTAFTNSAKVVLNVASGSAGEKFAKDHGVNHITR